MSTFTRAGLWLSSLLVLTAMVVAAFSLTTRRPATAAAPLADPHDPRAISCLGRIEPEHGVIRISARSLSGQPSIVGELRVDELDAVEAGQLVAVLNSAEQLDATRRGADARVALARSRLAQIKAGPKAGDLSAQQAEIARLESALATARADYRRYEQLSDVVTAADLDQKRMQMETTSHLLEQAKARLSSLAEVRDVDVSVASAELTAAIADAEQAKADLNQAFIRAPVGGRVLQIHAWPGEEVGPAGVMEIGQTGRMYVIAEVPQVDVGRVQAGQRAEVTGDALPSPLVGVVEQVAAKVAKNDVLHVDPMALSDARVVEAKIRLDDSRRAERLIHAEVTVIIRPPDRRDR